MACLAYSRVVARGTNPISCERLVVLEDGWCSGDLQCAYNGSGNELLEASRWREKHSFVAR